MKVLSFSIAGLVLGACDAHADAPVFQVNFEHDAPGLYSRDAVARDFAKPDWSDGIDEGRAAIVADPAGGCGQVLRITYDAGQVGGGVIIPVALPRADELYLGYRVFFPAGFDFVKEGKLSGLCGGACNSGGVRPDGRDGWSSRILWQGSGRGAQYLYWPGQNGKYGDMPPWSGAGFATGVWHTVVTRVKMNHPGRADGISETWLDGRRVYVNRHVRWRDTTAFAIDSFRFETFFGGGSADYAPATPQTAYFDDIVVSRSKPAIVSDC